MSWPTNTIPTTPTTPRTMSVNQERAKEKEQSALWDTLEAKITKMAEALSKLEMSYPDPPPTAPQPQGSLQVNPELECYWSEGNQKTSNKNTNRPPISTPRELPELSPRTTARLTRQRNRNQTHAQHALQPLGSETWGWRSLPALNKMNRFIKISQCPMCKRWFQRKINGDQHFWCLDAIACAQLNMHNN